MKIETLYWKDAGPWITKTDGHVDKKEFLKAALADKDTKEILDGEEMQESDILVSHIYIKPVAPGTTEHEENGGEDDETIWIDALAEDEGAEPVTIIDYEFHD